MLLATGLVSMLLLILFSAKSSCRQAIYYELREKFNLPAQFAIRAISRVSESYKVDKKVQHYFQKDFFG